MNKLLTTLGKLIMYTIILIAVIGLYAMIWKLQPIIPGSVWIYYGAAPVTLLGMYLTNNKQ